MSRKSWDEYFLDIAEIVATRSTCPRLHVGCVIVETKTHRIVSTGYNGSLPGEPHCEDEGCELVGGHCVRTYHAEVNALDYIPEEFRNSELTVYISHRPCDDCMDLLDLLGMKRFAWRHYYESPQV